jgi:uncharacterized protein (TIGR03066 family)
MRPAALRLAALGLLVLAAGCASHNKDKLVGKWEAKNRALEFKSDQTLTYDVTDAAGQELKLTGKYECNSGYFVTLKFDQKLNDRKQHVEKIVVEGDQLTMTDSDGTSVTFTRARDAKPAD